MCLIMPGPGTAASSLVVPAATTRFGDIFQPGPNLPAAAAPVPSVARAPWPGRPRGFSAVIARLRPHCPVPTLQTCDSTDAPFRRSILRARTGPRPRARRACGRRRLGPWRRAVCQHRPSSPAASSPAGRLGLTWPWMSRPVLRTALTPRRSSGAARQGGPLDRLDQAAGRLGRSCGRRSRAGLAGCPRFASAPADGPVQQGVAGVKADEQTP